MTIAAPTNRLRWLARLPTRMLAGWLLVAVLMGGGETAATETPLQVTASATTIATTTARPPLAETVRVLNTELAQAGPVTEAAVVVWRPADRPRSATLPGGLVQRGPPRG
ncbi:hypothetical protein F4553_007353 [Allocatelliglobosispora scoriae]|uniref:Uncharacterized protein n=1 Tax=Allocatelliglobosispora scoriae TaxID=643052 RepID=A0A841C3N2_9ACTN|nr:hypothetical protein [Allocatelliglobosispora scoriae]MBB5873919.1 hypothetical protein [Allocatelliglobosispora scoriae]